MRINIYTGDVLHDTSSGLDSVVRSVGWKDKGQNTGSCNDLMRNIEVKYNHLTTLGTAKEKPYTASLHDIQFAIDRGRLIKRVSGVEPDSRFTALYGDGKRKYITIQSVSNDVLSYTINGGSNLYQLGALGASHRITNGSWTKVTAVTKPEPEQVQDVVERVVKDRDSSYGGFGNVAKTSRDIQRAINSAHGHYPSELKDAYDVMNESLSMIRHKLARIVHANDVEAVRDSFLDIAGYAKLAVETIDVVKDK